MYKYIVCMRSLKLFIGSASLFLLPVAMVAAQGLVTTGSGGPFGTLLANILEFTNKVLIPFIIGIGFLVFVWGMFQYFILGGANDDSKEKGKSLMIYATLGFVLIFVFWGIVTFLVDTIGLSGKSTQVTIPTTPTLTPAP